MPEHGRWNITPRTKWVFFAVALAYLAMFLDSFPRVYIDEPWESIPAYQLFFKGVLNDPVLTGRTFNEEHLLAPRLVQMVTVGLFYRLFGPCLLVGRLTSLLYALGALFFFDKLLELGESSDFQRYFALALLCTNNFFFVFAHLIRPEIVTVFLGLASFHFLFKGITEGRRGGFAWAGVFAGIGAWSHPNFTLFILSLLLIMVYEYRSRMLRERSFWIFSAFFILGLSPYAVYLIHQDAGHNFSHFWAQISDQVTQGEEGFWTRTFRDELDRYRQYIFFPYRVPVVCAEVFFVCLSLRLKDRLSRFSQIIIITHLTLFPILIISRNARYFLPIIPFILLLLLRNIQQLKLNSSRDFYAGILSRSKFKQAVVLVSVLLLGYQIVGNPVMVKAKRVAGYEQLLEDLRQFIPPNSRVWGSMMFWFGFTDCDYRTQYTFGRDLYAFKPEYVITNDDVIWKKTAYISVERGKRWDELTGQIEAYTSNYGKLIAEVADTGYGDLRIWKIDTRRITAHATGETANRGWNL